MVESMHASDREDSTLTLSERYVVYAVGDDLCGAMLDPLHYNRRNHRKSVCYRLRRWFQRRHGQD